MRCFLLFILLLLSGSTLLATECLRHLNPGLESLGSTPQTSGSSDFKSNKQAEAGEVLDFYMKFEHNLVIKRGTVSHAVLAQTSWHTGESFDELLVQLAQIEDVADISSLAGAREIILQTALLSGLSVDEVLIFFRSFPDLETIRRGSLPALILMQTALITGDDVEKVIKFFDAFPRTLYRTIDLAHGLVVQTAYLTNIENALEAKERFRKLNTFLFATASHGYSATMIQTRFFAEGHHLENEEE